jgi:hypothetical protein
MGDSVNFHEIAQRRAHRRRRIKRYIGSLRVRVGSQSAKQIGPVYIGQGKVEQDQVRDTCREARQDLRAGLRSDDAITGMCEHRAHE